MLPDSIAAMVAAGESETLEFKTSTGRRREAAQAVCAMLNHLGGHVLFGVTPAGDITGQQAGGDTMEDISAELQHIEPAVYPQITSIPLNPDKHLIMVRVDRGHMRPYTHRGTAYRRSGSINLKMSPEEYNRMLFDRMHGEQRWENLPAKGWSIQDLDAEEIQRTVNEAVRCGRLADPATREPLELLRGLGLYKQDTLMRAAVVLFGKAHALQARMPQCLLRLAHFRGRDRTEFLDNQQAHGNAFELLLQAQNFVLRNIPIAGRVIPERLERMDRPLYPPGAMREALANAFCHRDYTIGGGSVAVAIYDDRLEITSSGCLHFGLTVRQLFQNHESLPWNPLIANVFYRRGLIEQWGRGILQMAELTTAAGLPRPAIEDAGGCVTVRFSAGHYVPPRRVKRDLSERQRAILAVLQQAGAGRGMAFRDIHAHFSSRVAPRQVRRDLVVLKTLGLVVARGNARGARGNLVT